MFYYIKGELVYTDAFTAVIDCGGIGYKFTVSGNTLAKLAGKTSGVKLYSYMYIREDAVELIGFYTLEELDVFKQLISVSGVGVKVAMAMLSSLTVDKLIMAIGTADAKLLSKTPGVGAKTAARIVLELKDKIGSGMSPAEAAGADNSTSGGTGALTEAQNALVVLGYSRAEALSALRNCPPGATVEEMITAALKHMGSI